jgi:yeast amino acid transporter
MTLKLGRVLPFFSQRDRPRRAHEIDLDTGRKVWDSAEKINAIRAERRAKPWYIRLYITLFSG